MGGHKFGLTPREKGRLVGAYCRYVAMPIAKVLDRLSTRYVIFGDFRNIWPSFLVGSLYTYGMYALDRSIQKDGMQGMMMASPYYRKSLNAERGGDPRVEIGQLYEGGGH